MVDVNVDVEHALLEPKELENSQDDVCTEKVSRLQ